MVELNQISKRRLLGAAVFALSIICIWQLKTLSTLIILSFLVAYVLNPVVARLERLRFVNRTGATTVTLVALLIGFLAVLLVIVPDVLREFNQFMIRVPTQYERLKILFIGWVENNLSIVFPLSIEETVERFGRELSDIAPKVIGPATKIAAQVFGGTFSVVLAIVGALMLPLFIFFLLNDFPQIVKTTDGLLPLASKDNLRQIAKEVDGSLSAFLHGQFMVMIVLGTLYSIGYSIIGIPVAIGVGLLTGILCFIPYVGAATGFVLALLLSLLDFKGFGSVLGVVVIFASVQLLDAILITPKILGGQLGLRPLWIIIALMAGAELFGFIGVLLAVPTIAVLKVIVKHTLDRYRESQVYCHTSDKDSPEPEQPETGEQPG
jgi:predicted PurR-regulated permease PerM